MRGIDLQIETIRKQTCLPYIDIIIDFAKDCGIDIEDLIKEVHSSIVDKIKNEFIRRNMVKGERITNCLDRFFEKKC